MSLSREDLTEIRKLIVEGTMGALNAVVIPRLDDHDRQFGAIDKRFDRIESRLDEHDRKFDAMDKRFDAMDRRFNEVDRRLGRGLAKQGPGKVVHAV